MANTNHTFFSFNLFKLDTKWRWMADLAKEESAHEVQNVLSNCNVQFRTYSTLGLRDDGDFMLWLSAPDIETIQDVVSKLYLTVFGKYIIPSRTYLSSSRDSKYAQNNLKPAFMSGEISLKYVIVYPFIKTRSWYLLPSDQRQKYMKEHIEVGQKYPQILLNTTYSFGIHDQDFMLAFETEDLVAFQDLIMELRETKVSEYVQVDTPMITCVLKDVIPLIKSLG